MTNFRKIITRLMVGNDGRCACGNRSGSVDVERYLTAVLAGGIPCVLGAAYYFGPRIFLVVLAAFLGGAAVETAFGLVRRKPIGGGSFAFAILLALLLPPSTPLWMVFAGSAFGIFFGKEVFGGTGDHIFCPTLVAKGFLLFSYPQFFIKRSCFGSMLDFSDSRAWITCSLLILAGGVAVVIARKSNLAIIGGILFAGGCVGYSMETSGFLSGTMPELLVADGFLFGALFLACDPSCSPRDSRGKWLYGILIGTLAVLMRCFSNYNEAMLSAVLLGNLFAPTIDAIADGGNDNEAR